VVATRKTARSRAASEDTRSLSNHGDDDGNLGMVFRALAERPEGTEGKKGRRKEA
jgi:hypothetical protein